MTRSCPSQGKVAPLGDERGSLPRATRGCVVLNSPSQTGKVGGLKYLCRTDRVDYSLGFIKGSASKARLCGLPFAKQGNGVDLALEEKVRRIPVDSSGSNTNVS